jgi:glycerate dehydrogenase
MPLAKVKFLTRVLIPFITPHISWAPKESRQRLMDIAVDNLRQFIQGKPVNIVS